MRILYIFPHPDDESFGPARAISAQGRSGHEVALLTLTKGGATKQRHRLGYSVEQMGVVRYREMLEVAKVLGLSDLTVLDLPDSGLKELDLRNIETTVANHIERVRPDIVVSYPVHGISGFHDHLVAHAVVKRVYVQLRDRGADYLKRLAFFTLTEDQAEHASGAHRLSSSTPEEIDCIVSVDEQDMDAFRRALDCYQTYKAMIERTGVRDTLDGRVAFEFFQEDFDPPITDLCEEL